MSNFNKSALLKSVNHSNGRFGNTSAPGHVDRHLAGVHNGTGAHGQLLEQRESKNKAHTVFTGGDATKMLGHGLNTDPHIVNTLKSMKPGDKKTITVDLKDYKGDKGMAQMHGAVSAALPTTLHNEKAQTAVYSIHKKPDNTFHTQTAYPVGQQTASTSISKKKTSPYEFRRHPPADPLRNCDGLRSIFPE